MTLPTRAVISDSRTSKLSSVGPDSAWWPAPGFEDTEFGVFIEPGGGSWRDGTRALGEAGEQKSRLGKALAARGAGTFDMLSFR